MRFFSNGVEMSNCENNEIQIAKPQTRRNRTGSLGLESPAIDPSERNRVLSYRDTISSDHSNLQELEQHILSEEIPRETIPRSRDSITQEDDLIHGNVLMTGEDLIEKKRRRNPFRR